MDESSVEFGYVSVCVILCVCINISFFALMDSEFDFLSVCIIYVQNGITGFVMYNINLGM